MSSIKSLRSATACLVGLGQESQRWEKDLKAISRGEKGELLRNNDIMRSFGQDLTTSAACDSDREASRRRRRKARDGGERRQVACAVHHQHTQHTDRTLLCVIVMCSTRSTSISSPARQSPDM